MANEETSLIRFDEVGFYYNDHPSEDDATQPTTEAHRVFDGLTIDLPGNVLSLVGENGIGKSTFLLLAGARLFPTEGDVYVMGRNTKDFSDAFTNPELEEERNRNVSFIYQNMEFETEESIGDLMEHVYRMGYHDGHDQGFLQDLRSVLELDEVAHKQLQYVSKGELQRAIIAFSMLYGSLVLMMDEPVFALEDHQKERAFEFLVDYAHRTGVAIYYSAHELRLTQKYSDHVLLFRKDGDIVLGPTEQIFTRDMLETAYQAPMDALYRKEHLYREMLNQASRRY